MADPIPEATNLALTALRKRRDLEQRDLASLADVSATMISLYENGDRRLSRKTLLSLAAAMDYSAGEVDDLLFGLEALAGRVEIPPEAQGLPPEVLLQLRREAIRNGRGTEKGRIAEARARRAEEARQAAARWVGELAALPFQRRKSRLEIHPELETWARVESLAHESERAAANDPWQAIEWAELAILAAETVAARTPERRRLLGYAWAYLANARRVTSDLRGADEAFRIAWRHWKAGKKVAWCPVEEWRLLDLEASLRLDQRDWRTAMRLNARVLGAVPGEHRGRVLLKVSKTYATQGDFEKAIHLLREAGSFIDGSHEPRLRLVYQLNLASCLALSGRPTEAESVMPEARELALRLRNEVDLTRTLWAQSWIHLAAGRRPEALAALDQVRKDFCARQIAYDAALVTLEEAVILLEEGDFTRVRDVAAEIYWVFASHQIRREALASLKLFYEAVTRNEITAALARGVLEDIRESGEIPRSLEPA